MISQSRYRRPDCIDLLDRITQYYVNTKDEWYTVLLRNMKVLSKNILICCGLRRILRISDLISGQ